MNMLAEMMSIARTRTRLTMKMVFTEDVFERDAITMVLNEKATAFSILRTDILSKNISQEEQIMLDKQAAFIKISLALQREAADLAMSDDQLQSKKAGLLVLNEVYPNQNVIIDYFKQLLDYQSLQLDKVSTVSLNNLQHNTHLNLLMAVLIFAGMLAILFFMVMSIRRIENQLVFEKEKAQVTLRSIGDGVISIDKEGRVEYMNQVATKIINKPNVDLISCDIDELFESPLASPKQTLWECIQQIMASGNRETDASEVQFGLKGNPLLILRAKISTIQNTHLQVSGAVISFHDVTESQKLMNKIHHQASHDALTGLLNRRAFEERTMQILRLYDVTSTHSFCIVDLDQFKIVNDSAGHAAGDELLKQLAELMKSDIGSHGLISRLGGDEFGVFIANKLPNQAILMAESLLAAIQTFGFYWESNVYRVGASIGMINFSSEIIDYEYLYQAADSACYIAKNKGRNQIYLMPLDAETLYKKAKESEYLQYLNQTLEHDQFILYGQVIKPLSLRTSTHKHIEVLLRMKDEHGNIMLPMSFIPIAERYGLMADIDYWVLKKVCSFIHSQPINDTLYAVNLSGLTLSSKEHMNRILSLLSDRKLPPGSLCLEVTETIAIANLDIARDFMATLKDYGCSIALDDFGSGLSSFSYLNSFPLDYLKIDGVFIKSMRHDNSSAFLVEAIHTVGKKLGLITIAEYVEDKDTVDKLKEIGVDMAQGFYFDKPHELPLDKYSALNAQTCPE